MTINDAEIHEILDNIYNLKDRKLRRRHSYVFIGKPGCGKTQLATKLAEATKCNLINSETCVAHILSSTDEKMVEQRNILKNGGQMSSDLVDKVVRSMLESENSEYRGFVLDGIPFNVQNAFLSNHFDALIQLIQTHGNCILVDLRINDHDLVRRRAATWIDPVTSISYPGQQVLYSRQRKHDGWIEGEEDTQYVSERAERNLQAKKATEAAVEDEEVLEEGEENEEEVTPLKAPLLLRNQMTYPILSDQILDRLIKCPENDPDRVADELKAYKTTEEKVESFRQKYFNALQIVEIDATQHPDVIYDQLQSKMDGRGYSIYHPLYDAYKLVIPEPGVKGFGENEVLKYFATLALREGEPDRELSHFRNYCPVTYTREKRLVETKMEIASIYKGKIYFFDTEECSNLFQAFPDKYLLLSPSVHSTTIAIIGMPCAKKSLVAKALAERYQLGYINIEKKILSWFSKNWTTSDDESLNPLFNRALSSLLKGRPIDADTQAEIFQELIVQHQEKAQRTGANLGWVSDGYPVNGEQIAAAIAKNLLPQHIYFIKTDMAESIVTNQLQEQFPIPLTRCLQIQHQKFPFYEVNQNQATLDIVDISTAAIEHGSHLETINWSPRPLAIFTSVLNTLDPFVPQAYPAERLTEGAISFLGLSKDYCPVTIKESNRLCRGDQSYSAKYMGRRFYFCDEHCRSKFFSHPHFYTKSVHIPPPRLIFFGASGSGKSKVMETLSRRYKIPVISLQDLCLNFDDSEIVKEYRTSNSLSQESMKTVLKALYTKEPFASLGFLLKGFPFSKGDVEIAIKQNLAPDAWVVFKVEPEVAARRLLKDYKASHGNVPPPMVAPVATEPEEGKEAVIIDPYEQLQDEFITKAEQQTSLIQDYTNLLETWGSNSVIHIDASRTIRPVLAGAENQLKPFLKDRDTLLTSASVLTEQQAKQFLDFGVKEYGALGKYCPVTLMLTGKNAVSNFGVIPIVHDDQIFLIKDKKAELLFLANPQSFLGQKTPYPVMGATCCIVGQAKSGKSSLSVALSKDLDCVHLTLSSIFQTILSGNEITSLCEHIRNSLKNGGVVSDQVTVDAVVLICNRVVASGKGWILDGFPITKEHALLLENAGFQPHIIFDLTITEEELIQRSNDDLYASIQSNMPAMHHSTITLRRNQQWMKGKDFIKDLFHSKYNNWMDINASQSKWAAKENARLACENAVRRRQVYLDLKTKGNATPVANIGLTNEYIANHHSKFRSYCPYSLVDLKELNTVTTNFTAEYNDQYYCLSSQTALDHFLANPEKYSEMNLPDELPLIRSKANIAFPVQLALKGYCPVTFQVGPPGFSSIVPGDQNFVAEYSGSFFTFRDLDSLQKFMRTPWRYFGLTLPIKLPPPLCPIPVVGLPIIGYLEQAVSSTLNKALLAVGRFRPKHPFKNLDQSASEYLGLYLKANNGSSKEWVRKSHGRKLANYMDNCSLLLTLSKEFANNPELVQNGDLEQKLNYFLTLDKKDRALKDGRMKQETGGIELRWNKVAKRNSAKLQIRN